MTIKIPIPPRKSQIPSTHMRVAAGTLLAAALLVGSHSLATAQNPPQNSQPQPNQLSQAKQTGQTKQTGKTVVRHRKAASARPVPAAVQTPPLGAAEAPAAPKPPDWPVNDKPTPAKVAWDSHGLRVEASNASLDQILNDVATDTGAKIEGLGQDERIFGTYGPGPAKDVLSLLLDGSGYNMLFIGDLGQGTPRQVILTPRTPGSPQTAKASPKAEEDEEEPEPQPEPQQQLPQPQPQPSPQPTANPFGGGSTPRTPQEIMQEMQQRQQQIQQQQQQPQ